MVTTKTNKESTTKKGTPPEEEARGLHLPSLIIKGFRGFKEMHLEELGQVTLLAGRNGAGKSTVLEAARLYASVGDPSVITDILDNRGNVLIRVDEDGSLFDVPDHGSLFFRYKEPTKESAIEIGLSGTKNILKIELSSFESKELKDIPSSLLSILEEEGPRCLTVFSGPDRKMIGKFPFFQGGKKGYAELNDTFSGFPRGFRRRLFGRLLRFGTEGVRKAQRIPYESLGPGLPSNEKIASWFESVELTSERERVLEALRLINPSIELLASQGSIRLDGPRMMVKTEDLDFPVPLKSMGEGIVHLLGLVVALVNAKDGLMLIDEIENGIHYSLFSQLWEFVMQIAQENNVQVIAATHSLDCFKEFTRVADENKNIEGRVIRIEREGEETWAVPYSEKQALIAAESGIEVR